MAPANDLLSFSAKELNSEIKNHTLKALQELAKISLPHPAWLFFFCC